ncbi:MAG: hypothetical protein ACI957_003747 [Verrucomicrobiales bacterium]
MTWLLDDFNVIHGWFLVCICPTSRNCGARNHPANF